MDLVHCFGSKELMSQDELAVMDGGKCILQLRGVRPFLSEKFDITKHPNYKYLSDYDKKNAFDIERFLSARLKLRPDEQFAAYSIGPVRGRSRRGNRRLITFEENVCLP